MLSLARTWVQHSRSKFSFVIDNALVFVAALFLALVYYGDPVFVPPEPREVGTAGCLSFGPIEKYVMFFVTSACAKRTGTAVRVERRRRER